MHHKILPFTPILWCGKGGGGGNLKIFKNPYRVIPHFQGVHKIIRIAESRGL